MDILLTPDIYTPSVDNSGNYIDKIPAIRNGIICPCHARKDKVYETSAKFASHIKSQNHQKWLIQLTQNKANYYVETIKSKELIANQQKIITNYENKINKQEIIINYLMEQIKKTNNVEIGDLLDIN
jgi:hypothetical protein